MALHLSSGSGKPKTVDMAFSTAEVRSGKHLEKIKAMMQADASKNPVMGVRKDGSLLSNAQLQQQALVDLNKVSQHEMAHADAAGKPFIKGDQVHFSFEKLGNILQVSSGHVEIKPPTFDLKNLKQTARNFAQVAKAALAPRNLESQIGEVAKPSVEDLAAHKHFSTQAKFAGALATLQDQTGMAFTADA